MVENKLNLLAFLSPREAEDERIGVVKPKTDYERNSEVSPIFQFTNSASILATEDIVLDFATLKPASAKYLPFNNIQILNNSGEVIILYINQRRDRPIYVPAGFIMPIDSSIAPAISSVVIKNNDASATIEANEIQILVSKDNVTTDKLAKNLHKLLLKGGN